MKSGTGPALASVGPDMKHFAGPHSAACAKVMEEGHQIIMIGVCKSYGGGSSNHNDRNHE